MEISENWLAEWIDLGGIEIDELAHGLTLGGLEVDGVRSVGDDTDDIVVGRIDAIEDHPDADRLVVCEVDVGDGRMRRIACGADNMKEGDRVPVAMLGSQPPDVDFEVTKRELMGVVSEGMLCSEAELGLADESEGLMILPADLELGEPVFEVLGLRDHVLEFDLTPNRADCLSHLGVAREVSAIFDRPLEEPDYAKERPLWEQTDADRSARDAATLEVRDTEGCPRYGFAVLEGVDVGTSPFWLRMRLRSVGLRSVNNVVDVTNFVLMDVGQPLHAFDLDELHGPGIVVRRAREGETLEGIDHETYELDDGDLVIADEERPVALAGVMGGAETEVGESTDRVLLECAYFDPKTVRRSSKRHGLHTESSHRFERRVDPGGLEAYADRAVRALSAASAQLPGGDEPTVLEGLALESEEGVDSTWTVDLPSQMAERVLGTAVDDEAVEQTLDRLGLEVDDGPEGFEVTVPTYRGDLRRPADLVEEVARLYGYDEIPEELPDRSMGGGHRRREGSDEAETLVSRERRELVRRVKTRMRDAGLFEAVNASFMSLDELDRLRVPDDDVRRDVTEVANPLRADERYMRTTLLPGLLENLQRNRAQKVEDVALFEVGRRYLPDEERATLGMLLAGRRQRHWSERREWDFFDLKGLVEEVGTPFATGAFEWREPDRERAWLHPGVGAEWVDGDDVVAVAGRLHPEIVEELELDGPVLLAEVDLEGLLASATRPKSFRAYSRQPPVERDVAVVVDTSVSFDRVREAIAAYRDQHEEFDELVEEVELFDVYEGDQVADGCRSLALSVRYRADDRTLTEDEVEPLDEGLVDWLGREIGAERR